MCDIDHFKAINDHLGHRGGDVVLSEVARRLLASIRAEDLLGRWGGDEFIVVCPFTSAAGATVLAERLRSMVGERQETVAGAGDIPVTISVGYGSSDGEDPGDLVHRADAALFAAKAAGPNRSEPAP